MVKRKKGVREPSPREHPDGPTGEGEDGNSGLKGRKTTVTAGGLRAMQIYLSPQERQAVREKAFADELSLSEVIRTCIREYFDLTNPPVSRGRKKRRS